MSLAAQAAEINATTHPGQQDGIWSKGKGMSKVVWLPFSSQQLTLRLSRHWRHEAGLPLHPFPMPGSHWKAAGQTGVGRRNAEPRPLLRDGGKPVHPGSCGSPVLRSLLSHWQSGCEAAVVERESHGPVQSWRTNPTRHTELGYLGPSPTSQGSRTACYLL